MCQQSDFNHLKLTDIHRTTLNLELDLWHRAYLPVKGTVLDAGAGCGETAAFFLNHGAENVICVECDPVALSYLRENFASDPRVTIIDAKLDNIKIDIEGGERNMVFETHFPVKFAKIWTAPLPAKHVHLWKLQATRDWGQLAHQYRIRTAHRIRLTSDAFGIKRRKRKPASSQGSL